ncbi:MAG: hypothetical protein ACTHM6_07320 [Tepidisphaeraceae bacterium]
MKGRRRWIIAESIVLILVLGGLIVAGLAARQQAWAHSETIRYGADMENGWKWGSRAHQEGLFTLYDRVVAESKPGDYGLDYMPLRLTVMSLWARGQLALHPDHTRWQSDYAFNRPVLDFNTACELLTAAGLFALTLDWVRRDRRRSLSIDRRPLHGVWLAAGAFALAWFNPASILSAHVRPTWDVWVTPFYVWAIFAASKNAWLTAGAIVGLGAMLKGQELIVAPLFILWPMMRLGFGAAARFIIGVAAAVAAIALPWLLPVRAAPIAFVVVCVALPVALWAALRRWPVRRLAICRCSMPARWLIWICPAMFAASVAICIPLFGASINWLRIGLIYGAEKFDGLEVGGADSLTAILQNVYHWNPKDVVLTLPGHFALTISQLCVVIFGLFLFAIAWAMRRFERAADRRFLLAAAAPWILYFAVFPKMHERYLLWGATVACAGIAVDGGALMLALFFSLCSSLMSYSQMSWAPESDKFLAELSPRAGHLLRAGVLPTYPGLAWAVLLATAIWLWMTLAPAFTLRLCRRRESKTGIPAVENAGSKWYRQPRKSPMQTVITGKVYVLGDNIDTDQIIPAEYLKYDPSKPEERKFFGMYANVGVPEAEAGLPYGHIPFVEGGQYKSEYKIVLGGKNFGCGSSREHAPLALAEAGIECVIAEFYARIFFRNSVNGGYLLPLESVARLVEKTNTGDELEVHVLDGYVLNKTKNQRHEIKPLGDVLPIIEAGGVFDYARSAGMLK